MATGGDSATNGAIGSRQHNCKDEDHLASSPSTLKRASRAAMLPISERPRRPQEVEYRQQSCVSEAVAIRVPIARRRRSAGVLQWVQGRLAVGTAGAGAGWGMALMPGRARGFEEVALSRVCRPRTHRHSRRR